MELKNTNENIFKENHRKRISMEIQREYSNQINSLKQRPDFHRQLEYFLNVLSLPISPQDIPKKFNTPLIGIYCIQAPLELFDALGFTPIRLCSGSQPRQRLSAPFMPVLSCPLIKSCAGGFFQKQSLEKLCDIIIIPTTCDWNTKLPELIKNKTKSLYIMELPHIKESERGRKRWIEEIYALKGFLQQYSGKQLNRKRLILSIDKYMRAWQTFQQLIDLKRNGQIQGTWNIIIANAFMLDTPESWTEKVNAVIDNFRKQKTNNNPNVFLAGSPVSFPYLKIPELIEEAGLNITADELCTSERVIASVVSLDPSEYGLFNALADRYHLACSCPTYTDNHRRVTNILNTMRTYNIPGLIYHQLKGCHPYDIESFYFEKIIKENGFHFLKIETDYCKEDRQNILIRLEAFKETLNTL